MNEQVRRDKQLIEQAADVLMAHTMLASQHPKCGEDAAGMAADYVWDALRPALVARVTQDLGDH